MGSTEVMTHDLLAAEKFDDSTNDPTSDRLELLESMQASASIMLDVVNDVLDLQKMESGNLQPETVAFDLYELFQTISNAFHGQAVAHGIEWVHSISEIPTFGVSDPMRIRQSVVNLLSK